MLGIGACKVVGAREILFGTHIKIVVLYMVEHCIDARNRSHLDGTRRETSVDLSIIWTIHF